MHLDSRGYAYETYREGGQVQRRYVGSGEWAVAAVRLAQYDRQRDTQRRQSEQESLKRVRGEGELLSAFCQASDTLLRATLRENGYYQHKRGPWRKRRTNPMSKLSNRPKIDTSKPVASPSKALQLQGKQKQDFERLRRANEGDKDAVQEVLAAVKGLPEEAALLDVLAPLGEIASERLIQSITDNELRRAGYRRRLEVMRDELAGPMPTALELHLAERVALCTLEVARMESVYATNASSSTKVWEACGRQLDGAHRRHLSAVKALAEVRKLKLPNIQVNIGEKQVNVSGDAAVVSVEEGPRGRVVESVQEKGINPR